MYISTLWLCSKYTCETEKGLTSFFVLLGWPYELKCRNGHLNFSVKACIVIFELCLCCLFTFSTFTMHVLITPHIAHFSQCTHTHFAYHFQRAQLLLSELEIGKNLPCAFRCCCWCCLKCLSICNCHFTIYFCFGGVANASRHCSSTWHLALATWHLALSHIEVDFAFLKYLCGLLWAQSAWTWHRLRLWAELEPATTTIVVQFIFI